MLMGKYPIFQYAFFVTDLDASIEKWAKFLGAGPFFVARHHKTDQFSYRGQDIEADVSYAFAYCGETQVQLIEQHDDQPSIYRDMYAKGEEGFHHIGVLVSDFEAEQQRLLDMGLEIGTALYADGVNATYFDTRAWNGGFTEIHGDPPHILETFAGWKEAHKAWRPGDPVIANP